MTDTMDPNAAIRALRETVRWRKSGNADASDLERALHLFEELDEWLSRGGFLPDAWRQESRVEHLKSRGGF